MKLKQYIKIMLLTLPLTLLSCADNIIDAFELSGLYENGEAYQPHLEIFIFRGTQGFTLPDGETNAANYVVNLFNNGLTSVHKFMRQNDIAFYESDINIYYVKMGALIDTYFSGGLSSVSSLTLTDETGTFNKGTILIDYNKVVIFFAQSIHVDPSVSGFSVIGTGDTINNPSFRTQYRIAIGSNYFGSFEILRRTVSHELGHYFGLVHSFETTSCSLAPQGTTLRIMDYVTNAENFIGCEQSIAKNLASVYLQKTPFTAYTDGEGLDGIQGSISASKQSISSPTINTKKPKRSTSVI